MTLEVRQGQVNLARLVGRIRAEFPELGFSDAVLNDFGEDHAVVVLDERWVFRFPRSAAAAACAGTERRLLGRLNAVSAVATPRYEHVSQAGDFGGYRMIAGQELTEAAFAALPHQAQETVLDEIGRFLGVLHTLPAALVARPDGEPTIEDAAWFAARYAERRARLAEALGPALLVGADRFYAAFPAAVATTAAAVIHHDFSEDHILLDPQRQRLAGVIDFTDAALGDPAFDFTYLWSYGRRAPARALRSYGAGAATASILTRSLWWFVRYRIDQVWWSVSGARAYDVARIVGQLPALFGELSL
jgi:aminoglycoside 2''-phosphotransferase